MARSASDRGATTDAWRCRTTAAPRLMAEVRSTSAYTSVRPGSPAAARLPVSAASAVKIVIQASPTRMIPPASQPVINETGQEWRVETSVVVGTPRILAPPDRFRARGGAARARRLQRVGGTGL